MYMQSTSTLGKGKRPRAKPTDIEEYIELSVMSTTSLFVADTILIFTTLVC